MAANGESIGGVAAAVRALVPRGVRRSLMRALIPVLQAYIRYAPFPETKRAFLRTISHVTNPYLALGSHRFVTTTDFGSRIAGDTRDFLQRYVYYFGIWEPNLTRWIQGRLARSDTFIDVGANVGYYTLLASRLVGDSGAVVAIEASPPIFLALQENLALNQTKNVRAVNVAVLDKKGRVRVLGGPDYNIGATSTVAEFRDCECVVEADTLYGILTPRELQDARLVKVDVEGGELAVAAGMGSLLSSGRGELEVIVEVHLDAMVAQRRSPDELVGLFRDFGFHPYVLSNEYSPSRYLPPYPIEQPLRLRGPVRQDCMVVFSREEKEQLSG